MLKKLFQSLRALRRGDEDPDWEFDERRDLVRMRCHIEVSYSFKDKRHKGQIVDMSLGGMKLRCFQTPQLGDTVDVTYHIPSVSAQNQTVPCRVQWVRSRKRDYVHFVGLAYDASDEVLRNSWVKMLLKQLGFSPEKIFQRRKFVRADCIVPARVIFERVRVFEGRLYNLGIQGALVEGQVPVGPNQIVELQIGPFEHLPMFQVTGTVIQETKHHGNYLLGIKFDELSAMGAREIGVYLRHLLLNHWEA